MRHRPATKGATLRSSWPEDSSKSIFCRQLRIIEPRSLHRKLHQLARVRCIPLQDGVEETAVELISFNELRDVRM
jgi:hypothetical protein